MLQNSMKIGFFDSGVGGLAVLKAVTAQLPEYDYYYFGDTKNLPYGDKTEAEIYAYTEAAVQHLFSEGCQLIVVACNTASAETLRRLQDEYLPRNFSDRRILGVIVPTIEALATQHAPRALLIGTRRTISSRKYERELAKRGVKNIALQAVATPELVPLIEAGEMERALEVAIRYIDTEAGEGDTVILGCTHYVLLTAALRAHYKERHAFISQDEVIPAKLALYLARHPEIEQKLTQAGTRTIHLTEHRPQYDQLMSRFLGGVLLQAPEW